MSFDYLVPSVELTFDGVAMSLTISCDISAVCLTRYITAYMCAAQRFDSLRLLLY